MPMKTLILLAMVFALGAGAQALGLLPSQGELRDIVAPPAADPPQVAAAPLPIAPQAEPEIEFQRVWDEAGSAYALVTLRNEGKASLKPGEARIHCRAYDLHDRVIGTGDKVNGRQLGPGKEATLRVAVELHSGEFDSVQCLLNEGPFGNRA